jgi:TadE-like protein
MIRRDDGSAVVEFTLVSILLVTLFLAVLQVGLVIHVRNTLVASAAEGARYAANADRGFVDGVRRTQTEIARAISPGFADDVDARYVERNGVTLVEVRVRATFPLLGLVGPADSLEVVGHAVEEAP